MNQVRVAEYLAQHCCGVSVNGDSDAIGISPFQVRAMAREYLHLIRLVAIGEVAVAQRESEQPPEIVVGKFVECESCAAKPGSPTLCLGCVSNRETIEHMNRAQLVDRCVQTIDQAIDGARQRRRHSFAESLLNTASGFVVSNLIWPLVCRFLLHIPYHFGAGVGVVALFTVVSIARNYFWRRLFNRPWRTFPSSTPKEK